MTAAGVSKGPPSCAAVSVFSTLWGASPLAHPNRSASVTDVVAEQNNFACPAPGNASTSGYHLNLCAHCLARKTDDDSPPATVRVCGRMQAPVRLKTDDAANTGTTLHSAAQSPWPSGVELPLKTDEQQPCRWWAQSSLARVMPQALPPPPSADDGSRRVDISLAGNEHESFQLALRSDHDLTLTVQLPQLRAVGHTAPPLSKLSWRQAGFVWAAAVDTGAHGDNLTHHGAGWWPDPLLAVGSAMAVADVTTSLWFTLYAPADTAPGLYGGTVSLHGNTGPQPSLHIELPLSVWVYNFSLSQSPALKTAFNLDRGRIADKYGANVQQSTLMTYARWLLTNFSVNPGAIYEPPATYSVAEIVELAALGMNALTLFPSGHDMAQANKVAANVSSLVSALSRHNLSAQLQLNYYGFDESNDLRGLQSTFEFLKQRFPAISSLTTAHFEHIEPAAIRNLRVDLPCPIFSVAAAFMSNVSRCVQAGIEVWTYVTPSPWGAWLNWRIDNELFEPRLIFWQTSMMQLSGFLYEGLNAWGQNWTLIDETALTSPFLDRRIWSLNTNKPRGVGVKMLTYPGKAAPIPSQRLAAIRDGIEDFGYFDLLRKTNVDPAVLSAIFANITNPRDLSQHISGTERELRWMMARRDEVARLIEAHQVNRSHYQ